MMRHFMFVMLLATAYLCSVPANAQNKMLGSVEILSEGMTTCGEFTAQPAMQEVRMEWVLGYISGVNAGVARTPGSDTIERMAGQSFQRTATAIGWLQSYCSGHPLEIMGSAAEALRTDLIRHERPSK